MAQQQASQLLEYYSHLPIDSSLIWIQQNKYENTEDFLKLSHKVLSRANRKGDTELLGDIHYEMADWFGYHGLFSNDSVVYHSEKAVSFYSKTEAKNKLANAYRGLALDYANGSQLKKAHTVLFQALEIFEEERDTIGIANCYRTLASLSIIAEDPTNSIKYGTKALPFFRVKKEYASLAITYLNLINAYTTNDEYPKALQAADSCLKIVRERVPEEIFVRVRALTARGEAYLRYGEYGKAYSDFLQSYELCKEAIGEERAATWRTSVGRALLEQKKYEAALPHYLAGIAVYKKQENDLYWPELLNIARVYEGLGEHDEALRYVKEAMTLKDTIHNHKIKSLKDEALVKYETGKKDEAIAQQAQLLQQKNKNELLILGIAALLLLLLLALFYFFRKMAKAKEELQRKNDENELLLKEVHHRVKNNLEMVKSLIALQSAQIQEGSAKEALVASQNRVQSMGIIHQKLYQGTSLGSIEMKDYFINLSEGVLDNFEAEDSVKILLIMDELNLDIDTAVPIGLIVNELLTNALKYAFPQKKGEITISLNKDSQKTLRLRVSDNGIGKTENTIIHGTGFGTQLITLLTRQLNGTMKEDGSHGTAVEFEFKIDVAA